MGSLIFSIDPSVNNKVFIKDGKKYKVHVVESLSQLKYLLNNNKLVLSNPLLNVFTQNNRDEEE